MVNRKKTIAVLIPKREGGLVIGGQAPIVVQSMTNTDTANVEQTTKQIIELAKAGSEMVRVTVNTEKAAQAIPLIDKKLEASGWDIPLVGDFHFNGHELLEKYPRCAKALSKYRINPGNVGIGADRDHHFATFIRLAKKYQKPIRIGVNWGSLDQEVLKRLMDDNAKQSNPIPLSKVMQKALVASAIESAKQAVDLGLAESQIILSCKVSDVQDLIAVYRDLAQKSPYALHVGLTEAGGGSKGIVASCAALSVLLQEGIGDTIRISITPEPYASRAKEVIVAQELLQSMKLRHFVPEVISCPGCGRTSSVLFQELAKSTQDFLREQMPIWKEKYDGVEKMQVAVMGCVVNGPGESRHAHIGISLPGNGESPMAMVFEDGRQKTMLRGENLAAQFHEMITRYVQTHY